MKEPPCACVCGVKRNRGRGRGRSLQVRGPFSRPSLGREGRSDERRNNPETNVTVPKPHFRCRYGCSAVPLDGGRCLFAPPIDGISTMLRIDTAFLLIA